MKKCDMCSEYAEAEMSWLVHTRGPDQAPTRETSHLCGCCAAIAWERVSAAQHVADTVIIQDAVGA